MDLLVSAGEAVFPQWQLRAVAAPFGGSAVPAAESSAPGAARGAGCAGLCGEGRAVVSARLGRSGAWNCSKSSCRCGGKSEDGWRFVPSPVREAPSSRELDCAVGCVPLGWSCLLPAPTLGNGQRLQEASATCKSWNLCVPRSLPSCDRRAALWSAHRSRTGTELSPSSADSGNTRSHLYRQSF